MEIREEFEALIAQEHLKLVRWLTRQTRDWHLSEDIAQRTYLLLWRRIEKTGFMGPGLLYRAAMQRLIEHYRLKRAATVALDGVDTTELAGATDFTRAFDDGAEAEEILGRLSDASREVLLLDVAGYSLKEMALHLGITVAAVKSRLTFARERARSEARKLRSA